MPANWDFLRRISMIDRALGGDPPKEVARVQQVSDQSYLSSRERAPCARHWGSLAASAVATEHGGIRLYGIDRAGPLRNAQVVVQEAMLGIASVIAFIADPSTLTLVSDTQLTPACIDEDDEVKPRINTFYIDVANIPAFGSGVVSAFPQGTFAVPGLRVLPGGAWWPDGATRSLFLIHGTAQTEVIYKALWQAIRK